jgi:hydrogenase maturation protease
MTEFLVIGIGSELRGDDSVGLVVARQLKNQVPPGVRIIEHYGDGTALISAWQGVDKVILIDATSSGAESGTIVRFDALSAPLPARISASSTHAFGLEEALELSRQLDQLPMSLVIYGIEGKSFSFGTDLSREIALAVEAVVGQILVEISTR